MQLRPGLLILVFLAGFVAAHIYPLILAATANSQTYAVATITSYHFDRHKNYNEDNFGLGIERRLSDSWSVSTGFFRNSFNRDTAYAFAGYTPLELAGWRVGAVMGGVTGYESGVSPWVTGLATRDFGHIGLNLVFSPAGIALQVKLRLWR